MHIRRGIARTTAAIAEVPRNNSFFLTLFYGLRVKLSVCNISYYTFLKITIFICADSKKSRQRSFPFRITAGFSAFSLVLNE